MYKLQQNSVQRLSDGASIPFADGNRDYEEYKQWLLEGNTPEPEFTDEELAQRELDIKISEAHAYLTNTDWIITKISEAQVLEEPTTELLTQYSEEISKRKESRDFINSVK